MIKTPSSCKYSLDQCGEAALEAHCTRERRDTMLVKHVLGLSYIRFFRTATLCHRIRDLAMGTRPRPYNTSDMSLLLLRRFCKATNALLGSQE